jgi:hypothetical protein
MRESMQLRSWRLYAAVAAIVAMLSCGVPARAEETGGLSALRKFPAAVTAVGVGSVDGAPLTVVATRGAGIYATAAGGTTFRKLSPALDVMRITSIAVLGGEHWLVGTDGDGLWQTGNAGSSFTPVTTLDCPRIARMVPDPAGSDRIFVASLCTGLHYSVDNGATWTDAGNGIISKQVTDVVRLDTNRIVVTTTTDGASTGSGVYISTNNGKSYTKMACPITQVDAVAWNAKSATVFVAGGTRIVATSDAGTHWKTLTSSGTVTGLWTCPSGWLLSATSEHGLLAWDAVENVWLSVAGSAQLASATSLAWSGAWLTVGGADGTVAQAALDRPVAAGTSSLALGTVPANQRRQAHMIAANIGAGMMTYQVAGTSAYLTATPQSGSFASRSDVSLAVDGTQLANGTYERLVKIVTNGGELPVTIAFAVGVEQPVIIKLTIGRTAATVGTTGVTLDAAPYIDKGSGRTMVPMRFVGEAFGASVTWNAATRRVSVETEGTPNHKSLSMVMTIGSKTATVNGKSVTLDVVPAIVAGRTFVPLRVISETLGAQVSWNEATRTVRIEYMP